MMPRRLTCRPDSNLKLIRGPGGLTERPVAGPYDRYPATIRSTISSPRSSSGQTSELGHAQCLVHPFARGSKSPRTENWHPGPLRACLRSFRPPGGTSRGTQSNNEELASGDGHGPR